jgi:DNA-binding NtrC family response regulator
MTAASILVVEDEFVIALEMTGILTGGGFRVVGPAGNVAEALRLVALHEPCAALVDNSLNGRSAAPVAAALQERRIPFAFVTGHGRDNLPSPYARWPLIQKPFDRIALIEAVHRLLRDGPGPEREPV